MQRNALMHSLARTLTKTHFMSLQQTLLPAPAITWFKQPVAVMLGLCVAGLMAVAILFSSSAGNTVPANNGTEKLQPSSAGNISIQQKKQASGGSTFSLLPGRLNRFLQ